MTTLKKISIILFISLLLAGCRSKTLTPYKHISRILSITSADQYSFDRDAIISLVSDELIEKLDTMHQGTIYDEKYHLTERNIYAEGEGGNISFILEYDCETSLTDYTLVVYAKYVDNILVDFKQWYIEKQDMYEDW